MSLQSAISALSPVHYWLLNEQTGTTLADIGSSPAPMTVSGDPTGMGAIGPEIGSFGLRLFSAFRAQSSALGLSAWTDHSLMVMFTAAGAGGITTLVPFAGIGNPASLTQRGEWFGLQSTASQLVQLSIANTLWSQALNAPWPQNFWHLFSYVYTAATHSSSMQIDGGTVTTSTNALGTVPTTSDPAWLQSTQPIVISHLARWSVALTPAQISSVSSQILTWPYGEPINVPVQGGSTTVDLTPVTDQTSQIISNQDTYMPQITEIESQIPTILTNQSTALPQIADTQTKTTNVLTDTTNMVNTLFPQLQTPIDYIQDTIANVWNGIQGVITGAGGAITSTIGQILSGKTLDLLTETDLGTVCFPDTLSVELGGGYFFAIKAILTSYPDWYLWTGPGETYATQSLGTLEVFRGGALVARVGLHTHTHEIYPLPGWSEFPIISEVLVPVPPDYNVVLVPGPETCWDLVALKMP